MPSVIEVSGVRKTYGKTVAVAPGDASSQLWTMFMNKVGLKDSDFKTITGNPQTTINAVITGQADLLVGFATIPLISVEQATKKPARAILFADYNVNVATLSIIARDDMIKDNADLLKRFMRATAKAGRAPGPATSMESDFSGLFMRFFLGLEYQVLVTFSNGSVASEPVWFGRLTRKSPAITRRAAAPHTIVRASCMMK